ncbi:M1 family aminopeptidase, partial [Mucilaginibacter antarcticus]
LTGLTRDLTSGSETSALQVHLQAVTDTLEWFSAQLTPYPYKQLSLLFTPEFGPSGYALPQVILMSHRLAVRARPATDAGFDQRYRRTAHEAAHQWFGHQIGYGVEADGSFLIESLAKYAELVLIEQRYGKEAMQSLVDYERQRYQHALRGRLTATRAIIDASSSPDVYA